MSLVEALEMDATNVPRIATSFGAGFGRHGEVCGALSGAAIALGFRFGRDNVADVTAKEATYSKVEALLQAFEMEFGTVICRELISCDLRTPEGIERFKAHDLHNTLCRKFVAFAANEGLRLMENTSA